MLNLPSANLSQTVKRACFWRSRPGWFICLAHIASPSPLLALPTPNNTPQVGHMCFQPSFRAVCALTAPQSVCKTLLHVLILFFSLTPCHQQLDSNAFQNTPKKTCWVSCYAPKRISVDGKICHSRVCFYITLKCSCSFSTFYTIDHKKYHFQLLCHKYLSQIYLTIPH